MNKIKKFLRILGPGFITGAADDDPTAIATYIQAGAKFGYSMLWTTLFTFPFMTIIQEMCGRIGLVTGKGLSGVIKHNYPRPILYFAVFLLLIANTINIGANLGAMAASGQLIFGAPFVVWLIAIIVMTLILEIFLSYKVYANFLKYLTLTLLAYVAVAFITKQNWEQIALSTFIPTISMDKAFLLSLVAILGTNISPYLFFWQADEEVEEEVSNKQIRSMGRGVPKISGRDLNRLRIDTTIGMFFSNVILFFILITAASTFGKEGLVNIQTPDEAAQILRPLVGDFSSILFSLGILGSGFLAIPVLSSSVSYAMAECFGWREGLYQKLRKAHGFYGVITIATLIGLLINFTSIKPFQMLIYSAVLNGILAPFLLVIIIIISNNKKIMGEYRNSFVSNFLGIFITLFMFVASIFLFINIRN